MEAEAGSGSNAKSLAKAILHNIGVVVVGFGFALLGVGIDYLLNVHPFHILLLQILGVLCILAGFGLRVWATYEFYERSMAVIVLHAQRSLITSGPFRYSRNPLYLGGNVFIFLGASLVLGTPGGVALTLLHLPLVNHMIRREEKQLEAAFGDEWRAYTRRTDRWI